MTPELRKIFSYDIDDLERYEPRDPECFRVSITIIVGPVGAPGEESFDFQICSSKWLQRDLDNYEITLLRHVIVMKRFDYDRLCSFVREYLSACSGATWDDVGQKVGRLGMWEFEDYKPYDGASQI